MSLSLTLDTPDLAKHYEQVSQDRQFKAGQRLVERLGIRSGERVLDVGAGTGLLAEYVVGLVGAQGAVVGVDPLPLRIEIARQKSRVNLSFFVGDAHVLGEFQSSLFDVVYLNAVFHWLTDKEKALREIWRVSKPGARLGISTGSKDHRGELQLVREAVLSREPYARYPEATSGLALHVGPSELRALLERTGWKVRSLELEPNEAVHASAEAAIEFIQASSFGNFLGHLPEHLRAAARADLRSELEARRTSHGIVLNSVRIVAIAEKLPLS